MKLSQLSLILIGENVSFLKQGIPKNLQQLFADVFDDFPEQKIREAFRWYLADRDEEGVKEACLQIADELKTEDDLDFIMVAICVLRKHDSDCIQTIRGILKSLEGSSHPAPSDLIIECCVELGINIS